MQITLNISKKQYEILKASAVAEETGMTVEQVLEKELQNADVFVEVMSWDNF
jgi:hypothetical protein